MASMTSPPSSSFPSCPTNFPIKPRNVPPAHLTILSCHHQQQQQRRRHNDPNDDHVGRRDIILRSGEIATVGAIINLSGTKPDYLGVQKTTSSLALCPATRNCISTAENTSDRIHYAPPWNYNPEEGRGSKNPISREQAMEELLEVIESTKPDKFTPRIMEKKDDYVRVEYQSPILGGKGRSSSIDPHLVWAVSTSITTARESRSCGRNWKRRDGLRRVASSFKGIFLQAFDWYLF